MNQKKYFVPPAEKTHVLSEPETAPEPKHILLLDDDADLIWTLKEFFESHNYQVTAVRNGVDGVKQVMAHDFDVILCDMLMPNLPGDMFYLAVERTKPHLCKRFVFISGHKGEPRIDAFIRKVRGLLVWKPFQPHELLERVRCIENKTAATGQGSGSDSGSKGSGSDSGPGSSPSPKPSPGKTPGGGTTFFIHT